FGQRLLVIFTALSPFYVEQPHYKGSALYKYPTKCCKNNLERSTAPNSKLINAAYYKAKISKVTLVIGYCYD
ncbi:MAG: hypothetical protein OQK09_08375, partial [Colwellia sp.]|nr:hypothetical protein [Colwellia sp.]MCW9081515.1 hypothetical protein [Colwellia sp.]